MMSNQEISSCRCSSIQHAVCGIKCDRYFIDNICSFKDKTDPASVEFFGDQGRSDGFKKIDDVFEFHAEL